MKITIDHAVLDMALAALKKCDSALSEELAAWDIDPPLHHVLEASNACGPSIAAMQEALAQQNQVAGYVAKIESLIAERDALQQQLSNFQLAQPQQEPVAGNIEALRHSANEWADMAANGFQWVRNIVDGISTPAEALESLEDDMRHCREVNDAPEVQAFVRRPPPARKPLTDWVNVDERLPEKGGYYLVTVDTDDGPHVDVLLFNGKYWEHEGEPTFCHSYLFRPTHWANRPEAAHGIKDTPC